MTQIERKSLSDFYAKCAGVVYVVTLYFTLMVEKFSVPTMWTLSAMVLGTVVGIAFFVAAVRNQ